MSGPVVYGLVDLKVVFLFSFADHKHAEIKF